MKHKVRLISLQLFLTPEVAGKMKGTGKTARRNSATPVPWKKSSPEARGVDTQAVVPHQNAGAIKAGTAIPAAPTCGSFIPNKRNNVNRPRHPLARWLEKG